MIETLQQEGDTTAINFRPLRDTDYQELRGMIFAFYDEGRGVQPITDEKILKTVTELARNPCKGEIIIFEKDNMTIGYSILIFYWSNEYGGNILHIDEIYVKQEHRRRGVATSFFDHVFRAFKGKMVALQLEASPSSIDYYRKLGFRKTRNIQMVCTRSEA
jgi:GNAT superfamily N-acetyltransferase